MQKERKLYDIRDLECAYEKGKAVLSVPEISFNAGKVIVVLGKSGYGKSTFLETLALMNNTIAGGEVIFYPPSAEDEQYNLGACWNHNGKQLPSSIRAAHFSFIFQQTNLMPNFSVYENIYVTKMIQGIPETQCQKETADIIERIGLSGIEANRKVTELSGGQRQRVAFARAITGSFDVLFGDEPTGNLDEFNAKELLTILADFIHQSSDTHPKTAVIVTHSIDMAVAFADSIVMIKKVNGSGYIDHETLYNKQSGNGSTVWTNGKQSLDEKNFTTFLREQFSSY